MKDYFTAILAHKLGGGRGRKGAAPGPRVLSIDLAALSMSLFLSRSDYSVSFHYIQVSAFSFLINFSLNMAHCSFLSLPARNFFQQLWVEPFSPSSSSYPLSASFHASQFKILMEDQLDQVHLFKPGHNQDWLALSQVPPRAQWLELVKGRRPVREVMGSLSRPL